jgi:hypothetical protein
VTSSQIFAISGILTGDRTRTRDLISYAVALAGLDDRPARFCFIPTAEGDNPYVLEWFEGAFGNDPAVDASTLTLFTRPNVPDVRKHLLAQDVLWVGGGSVINLMAVWRAHGTYRRLVALGELLAGYATEDGVGLHYVDGVFREAVSVQPDARAWYVEGEQETEIVPRYLEEL